MPLRCDDEELLNQLMQRVLNAACEQSLPIATYRLQFNQRFSLNAARSLTEYLSKLGVSDLYASPLFRAQPGSMHGYNVVDPGMINPELGTRDDLQALSNELQRRGLGLILDVVPNHMSAASHLNRWWQDVLENGPGSAYAHFFDIDWSPLKPDLVYKVLLPVLGDQFGRVLEDGQLMLTYEDGAFVVHYWDQRFPVAPRSYAMILGTGLDDLQQQLGTQNPDLEELLSILTAIRNLPLSTETSLELLAERRREKEVIKRRLHSLTARSGRIAEFINGNVAAMNGCKGEASSFDRLDELLHMQHYRLSYWRVAADEINYRRFFDINDLAAICVEHADVFEETHRLVFELVEAGVARGLRIDHSDGLYDPSGYLRQLQERRFLQLCRSEWEQLKDSFCGSKSASTEAELSEARSADAFGGAEQTAQETIENGTVATLPEMAASLSESESDGEDVLSQLSARLHQLWHNVCTIPGAPLARPMYLVVEKILGRHESVPADWPVHGTVGYEFLNTVNGLFVDDRGERAFSNLFTRFTGESRPFREIAWQCKHLIAGMSMASEVSVLGERLDRISEQNRWTRDFTLRSLTQALVEVISCFGVYRTYVTADRLLDRDRRYVEQAVSRARRRNPAMNASIFDFLRDVLLLHYRENADTAEREAQLGFVGRFQQLTGPIMARSVEDTAFYRFNRLASLNEVGGDPEYFGVSVDEFHFFNQQRLPRLAYGMSATSTHDTKRGEDVRARINVLSEIPRDWQQHVSKWARWNRRLKVEVDGEDAPGRNDEYLLYQTLVGIWPDEAPQSDQLEHLIERLKGYMLKVAREAKTQTSWISPHQEYEDALQRFVSSLFDSNRRVPFLDDLQSLARKVAQHGYWNSLAQLVLKIASPGVADFYQGAELWNLTLVDPDNRQPVDFDLRTQLLDELLQRITSPSEWIRGGMTIDQREALLNELLGSRADGRIKLFITMLGLHLRRELPELFTTGHYLPLEAEGPQARHVVAFARQLNEQVVIAIVPRLTVSLTSFGGAAPLGDVWHDTFVPLPAGLESVTYRNAFTGELLSASVDNPHLHISETLHCFPVSLLISETH